MVSVFVDKCPAGQQPNAGNNGCEECGLGYYQPLEYQEQCLECPGILSTRTTGSTSQASCESELYNLIISFFSLIATRHSSSVSSILAAL